MQIKLSTDEYRQLVDILYLADWMLTARKVGDDPRVEAYHQLVQKLYARAQEMGLSHLIEYAEEFDQYSRRVISKPIRPFMNSLTNMMMKPSGMS